MSKTWTEKLAVKTCFPKVLNLEKRFPCYNSAHAMGVEIGDPVVLVNASEIIPLMSKVPKGKLITIREICQAIAKKHNVQGCCSLVTGIYITVIANAVEEITAKKSAFAVPPAKPLATLGKASADKEKAFLAKIPYWRTLKSEGFLNEKYPGGQENHKKLLEKEGFEVISRGKKYQVADWQEYLAKV